MADTVMLVNEKASILDLSALADVHGKKVVLQPKGRPGSSRECHVDVLENDYVKRFMAQRPPWLSTAQPGAAVPTPAPPPPSKAVETRAAPVVVPETPAIKTVPLEELVQASEEFDAAPAMEGVPPPAPEESPSEPPPEPSKKKRR